MITKEKIEELISRYEAKAQYYANLDFLVLEQDYRELVGVLKEIAAQSIDVAEIQNEEIIHEERANGDKETNN